MGIIDNHGRELAADKVAALRTQLGTARNAATKLSRENAAICRELGFKLDSERAAYGPDSIYGPNPESVIGKLATLRLARLRAGSDKPSAEELKFSARRGLLEGASVGLRAELFNVSNRIVDAQLKYQRAVEHFDRNYPVVGAVAIDPHALQPVP